MKQVVRVGIVAAVMMTAVIGAQGKNFGGTWVVDPAKTNEAGGEAVMVGGGRARSGGGGGAVGGVVAAGGGGVRGAGGGGRGGGASVAPVPMSITVDAKTFAIQTGETITSYSLDGSVKDMSNEVRAASAKAEWKGEKVVIETTAIGPNGPIVSTASWYLEGEWLVRENTTNGPDGAPVSRKTYYKRG